MNLARKRLAGIILAAGKGSRMGRTKQLLPYKGTTLLGTVIEETTSSALSDVVVVLGFDALKIMEQVDMSGARVVMNPRFEDGQATSLCAGLAAVAPDCGGAVFLLGDQPQVTRSVINRMIDAWYRDGDALIQIPFYQKKRGNPVIVDRALFKPLSQLTGDTGARALFSRYENRIQKIHLDDPGILLDVDTPEDYDRLISMPPSKRRSR